jgi:hypothetical protein
VRMRKALTKFNEKKSIRKYLKNLSSLLRFMSADLGLPRVRSRPF